MCHFGRYVGNTDTQGKHPSLLSANSNALSEFLNVNSSSYAQCIYLFRTYLRDFQHYCGSCCINTIIYKNDSVINPDEKQRERDYLKERKNHLIFEGTNSSCESAPKQGKNAYIEMLA